MTSNEVSSRREFLERLAKIMVTLPAVGATVPLSTALVRDASLLEPILANPEDDAPRLAYANWLTRQGNPLGEFIRMQCQVDRLNELHPDWYGLRFRLANLLRGADCFQAVTEGRDNAAAWKQSLRRVTDEPVRPVGDGEFHRGMIEEFTAYDIGELRRVEADVFATAPLIQTLRLWGLQQPDWIRELKGLGNLPKIKSLVLRECTLGERAMAQLAQCAELGGLQHLALVSCVLDEASLSRLAVSRVFENLGKLTIERCAFGRPKEAEQQNPAEEEGRYATLFRSTTLANLRAIEIAGRFSRDDFRALIDAPVLRQLQSLEIRGGVIGADLWQWLLERRALPELRELYVVATCHEDAFPIQRVWSKKLKKLALIRESIEDAGLEAFASHSPTSLQRLDLKGNHVTDEGLRSIASSHRFQKLRYLDLGENAIATAGARHIADSTSVTNLLALRLPWTQVGDDGTESLAASPNLRSLRFLNLCDCGLNDASAEAIASSSNFSHLSWLNLDDNAIGRQGGEALAASPFLKNVVALRVRDNPLGDDDLQRLKSRFGSEALESWWLGYLI